MIQRLVSIARFNSRPRLALVCLALGATTLARAAGFWENVQVGGFISQGYLKSTNNNYPVDTKDSGTFDFREMAVRGSTTFGPHLRVGGQLFAQTLGKYGDDKVILDWAVLDYNFSQQFGVRVGRVKYPRSLHSEVLDADEIRPFVLLPQSIYDARLRDFQSSFDGAMVYGTLDAGSSSFDYKAYFGHIPMKTTAGVGDFFNTTALFAVPPGIGSLHEKDLRGAALTWNTPVSGLRAMVTYSRLTDLVGSGPFASAPIFTTAIKLSHINYSGAALEYATGPWTFTSEYLLDKGSSVVTLPSFIAPPSYGNYANTRYYFSAARKLGERIELGVYWAHEHNRYPTSTSFTQFRNDGAISARFDLSQHVLFKLEAHAINGAQDVFNVPGIVNAPAQLQKTMSLFAAKTTLTF